MQIIFAFILLKILKIIQHIVINTLMLKKKGSIILSTLQRNFVINKRKTERKNQSIFQII